MNEFHNVVRFLDEKSVNHNSNEPIGSVIAKIDPDRDDIGDIKEKMSENADKFKDKGVEDGVYKISARYD